MIAWENRCSCSFPCDACALTCFGMSGSLSSFRQRDFGQNIVFCLMIEQRPAGAGGVMEMIEQRPAGCRTYDGEKKNADRNAGGK